MMVWNNLAKESPRRGFFEWPDSNAIVSELTIFGESREVSEAVLFLASDASSYLTAAEIPVDGGMMATSHVFSDWLARRKGSYFSADDGGRAQAPYSR